MQNQQSTSRHTKAGLIYFSFVVYIRYSLQVHLRQQNKHQVILTLTPGQNLGLQCFSSWGSHSSRLFFLEHLAELNLLDHHPCFHELLLQDVLQGGPGYSMQPLKPQLN